MSQKKGFGLVRDKDGRPRVDDPATLHPLQIAMLTDAEKSALGVWPGAFIRDAEGFKRVERNGAGRYRAVDPIRAAGTLHDGLAELRLTDRRDVPAGEIIIIEEGS